MQSEEVPDEVPEADAAEQHRDPVERETDTESPELTANGVPLEATDSDWQEQTETVELEPEEDR